MAFEIWIYLFLAYIMICIYFHNRRLEALEEKLKVPDRKRVVASMLAGGVITHNEARKLLKESCTCEDLTTPAYPEFAAVVFDPECPIHRKKDNASKET